MKIPTPSFFRIRVVALILSFLALCLFVGLLKSAFAVQGVVYNGQCYALSYSISNTGTANAYTEMIQLPSGVWKAANNNYALVSYSQFWNQSFTWSGASWVQSQSNVSDTYSSNRYSNTTLAPVLEFYQSLGLSEDMHPDNYWPNGPPEDCGLPEPCEDAIQQAISDCGGEGNIDWTNYTEESCNLSCKCQSQIDEAELFCSAGYTLDRENCTYDCVDCDDYYQDAVALCADKGGIQSFNCNVQNSFDPNVQNEPPSYTCVDDNQVTQDPDNDTGDTPEDPADDPTPDPEDPDSDITNQWLAKIKQNTDTIVNQNNTSNSQQANIAENMRRSVENQSVINDSINNLGKNLSNIGAGIGDEVAEGVREGMQGVEDELEEISSGSYTPGDPPDPYAAEEEYSFGDRASEFLDQMKSTGVFSLPNQLSSAIPGGGTSTLIIEGGETYGSHTIDFSDYSPAILILRGIFQIAGMIIAIRIVTLKR